MLKFAQYQFASVIFRSHRDRCVFKRQERKGRDEDHLQKGDELVKLDGTPGPALRSGTPLSAVETRAGQVKRDGKLATSFQI